MNQHDPLQFLESPLDERISTLFEQAKFITSIRYYRYKVNLFLLNGFYYEVFVNHKSTVIEKISLLNMQHSRMKFYLDQISFEGNLN
jgi:hypothetical protein